MTTRWLARLVACLLALLTGNATPASASSAATTTNSSSGYVYEGPTIARVAVGEFETAAATPTQLPGSRDGCASSSAAAQEGSTTPSRSVNATEAAGPAGALERQWAQAPYDGFLGNYRAAESLQPGTIIDRYGGETGRFFSPAGTSFEARALPAGSGPLNTYEVLKPLDVQAGIVAPAFGQPGLGIQYMAPQTVADLIEGGFIKPVTP